MDKPKAFEIKIKDVKATQAILSIKQSQQNPYSFRRIRIQGQKMRHILTFRRIAQNPTLVTTLQTGTIQLKRRFFRVVNTKEFCTQLYEVYSRKVFFLRLYEKPSLYVSTTIAVLRHTSRIILKVTKLFPIITCEATPYRKSLQFY